MSILKLDKLDNFIDLKKHKVTPGHRIALLGSRKKFLSATKDGKLCYVSKIGPEQEFTVILVENKIALMSCYRGFISCSKEDAIISQKFGDDLKDDLYDISQQELWSVYYQDFYVYFVSYNGYHLSCAPSIVVRKETISTNERFLIHKIGKPKNHIKDYKLYGILPKNGFFLSARTNGTVTVVKHLKSFETFKAIAMDGKWAIRTYQGTFLSVKSDGSVVQVAGKTSQDTHFDIKWNVDSFTIQSCYGTYLSVKGCLENHKSPVSTSKKPESFTFLKIPQNSRSESFLPTLKHRILTLKKLSKMDERELDEHFSMQLLSQVEEFMKTGDILLFRGIEGFSQLIRMSSLSLFSHIMMLIRDPSSEVRKAYGISSDVTDRVFVFESDSQIEAHVGGGVQLLPIRKWMKSTEKYYDGNKNTLLCWRRLADFDRTKVEKDLNHFMLEMAGKYYKTSKKQLAMSVFGMNKKEDFQTIFCSELVTAAYKVMKLIPSYVNSNNLVPRDFTSQSRKDGKDLILLGGAILLNEVRIREETPTYDVKTSLFRSFQERLKIHVQSTIEKDKAFVKNTIETEKNLLMNTVKNTIEMEKSLLNNGIDEISQHLPHIRKNVDKTQGNTRGNTLEKTSLK